ncbi:hypothetical protein ACJIZ3_012612 [Penstemon smallii]|uniref:CCT domain-containing protein n=1 Tax=Penstemon smallii TaxID=265156 RepID=A0ABD3UMW7_9LAMI
MFGHNQNQFPYDHYSSFELNGQYILTPADTITAQPPQLFLPPLSIPGNEHDSVSALRSELGGYTSSGCSSYGGSPGSTQSPTNLIQRSISSHSLHRNLESYSPMNSSPHHGFFESETNSVRKALSTGDLQGANLAQHIQRCNSPLSNENSIIESMNRTCKYSQEEKKERIERYRSKRNLRNFNKKIKYECRKTLADSRPRIRGRFARNDHEVEKTPQSHEWDNTTGLEEDYEDEDNWIHFLDSFSEI